MPATFVETLVDVDPADLHPYPGHTKQHADQELDASLEHNGQYRSVVGRCLDDGSLQLLAGLGTTRAVMRRRDRIRVEVITCTDAEARRIVIAEDQLPRLGHFDDTALLALLDAANADGGLAGTGYDAQAYQDLIDSVRPVELPDDVDEASEPPANPLTQPGDVWTLGHHVLVCGSGLDPLLLGQALAGRRPGIVHVDPPYGINIVHADGTLGDATGYRPVIGDQDTSTAATAFQLLHGRYPDARHIWWGANHYAGSAGLPDSSCWLVWDKENGGNHFADAELAWTNHPGAVRRLVHRWNGSARASETGPRMHPNQKPVALIRWGIETIADLATARDRGLLDVCAGSGPSLLGAEVLGIPATLFELDPGYCDVIVQRWIQLTDEGPLLNGEPVDVIRDGARNVLRLLTADGGAADPMRELDRA